MIQAEFEAQRAYIAGLSHRQRRELKESEMDRMAYDNMDPLDVMIQLQSLRLLWY